MPITQARLEALVSAGEAVLRALERQGEALTRGRAALARGEMTPGDLLQVLDFTLAQDLAGLASARGLLLAERVTYRLTRSRNESETRRRRRARGEPEGPPAQDQHLGSAVPWPESSIPPAQWEAEAREEQLEAEITRALGGGEAPGEGETPGG